MKNVFKQAAAAVALTLLASAASAAVVATVKVDGGNVYYNDYTVTFGLGSTSTPTWTQRVATDHQSGDAFDGTGLASFDITSQFTPGTAQSWWVLVDDNWGGNDGFLRSFSIDTGTQTLTASGTPIFIADYDQAYAFINTAPANNVPEPMSVSLLGLGMAGLYAARRRKA